MVSDETTEDKLQPRLNMRWNFPRNISYTLIWKWTQWKNHFMWDSDEDSSHEKPWKFYAYNFVESLTNEIRTHDTCETSVLYNQGSVELGACHFVMEGSKRPIKKYKTKQKQK